MHQSDSAVRYVMSHAVLYHSDALGSYMHKGRPAAYLSKAVWLSCVLPYILYCFDKRNWIVKQRTDIKQETTAPESNVQILTAEGSKFFFEPILY